jgi:hypothetical protein
MSYNTYEQSTSDGQPVELFHFFDEADHHWRFTSAATAQTVAGSSYTPDTIQRETMEMADNHFKNELKVKLGRGNLFALNYVAGMFETKVYLDVYRMHSTDYITYWSGVVHRVVFDENAVATITAAPVSSDTARAGARRRCQIMCDLPLYSAYCSVARILYQVDGIISSVTGNVINCPAFGAKPDNWFTGGLLVVGAARRLIYEHNGSQILIARGIVGLSAGMTCTGYAGCNHTADHCLNKFSNKINYGGAEFLPVKNPFIQAIVY